MFHHTVRQDEQVSRLTGGVRGERRGGVADRPQHIQRARDSKVRERERQGGEVWEYRDGKEKQEKDWRNGKACRDEGNESRGRKVIVGS